jgi:hypothetical protein
MAMLQFNRTKMSPSKPERGNFVNLYRNSQSGPAFWADLAFGVLVSGTSLPANLVRVFPGTRCNGASRAQPLDAWR